MAWAEARRIIVSSVRACRAERKKIGRKISLHERVQVMWKENATNKVRRTGRGRGEDGEKKEGGNARTRGDGVHDTYRDGQRARAVGIGRGDARAEVGVGGGDGRCGVLRERGCVLLLGESDVPGVASGRMQCTRRGEAARGKACQNRSSKTPR